MGEILEELRKDLARFIQDTTDTDDIKSSDSSSKDSSSDESGDDTDTNDNNGETPKDMVTEPLVGQ